MQVLMSLLLEGAALLLVRAPGRDMSVSWEEPDPEFKVELPCEGQKALIQVCPLYHGVIRNQVKKTDLKSVIFTRTSSV